MLKVRVILEVLKGIQLRDVGDLCVRYVRIPGNTKANFIQSCLMSSDLNDIMQIYYHCLFCARDEDESFPSDFLYILEY